MGKKCRRYLPLPAATAEAEADKVGSNSWRKVGSIRLSLESPYMESKAALLAEEREIKKIKTNGISLVLNPVFVF